LRKLVDVSRIESLGWHYNVDFKKGLEDTYAWYLINMGKI